MCRQQGSKIGSTWSALSTAMKVMQHQKAVEKNAELAETGESQKEQLKLMLDAMWATNALDIQNTVAKACSMVRLTLVPAIILRYLSFALSHRHLEHCNTMNVCAQSRYLMSLQVCCDRRYTKYFLHYHVAASSTIECCRYTLQVRVSVYGVQVCAHSCVSTFTCAGFA